MNTIFRTNGGDDTVVNLKACPFCGSAAEISHIGNIHSKKQSIKIKCSNSSCRVSRTDSILSGRHTTAWLLPKSVESWNKRHPEGKE